MSEPKSKRCKEQKSQTMSEPKSGRFKEQKSIKAKPLDYAKRLEKPQSARGPLKAPESQIKGQKMERERERAREQKS